MSHLPDVDGWAFDVLFRTVARVPRSAAASEDTARQLVRELQAIDLNVTAANGVIITEISSEPGEELFETDGQDIDPAMPSNDSGPPFLTPDDTWCIWVDSYGMRRFWATVVGETVVNRDGTDTTPDEVVSWSVDLIDDLTRKRFTVDHQIVIATMQRILAERATIQLADTIIDRIATVLDAKDHEHATDELCQLDADSDDAIVQIATFGQVLYG